MARLVVAKHRLPYPAVTGTDVVTFNLLRALASRHDVTLVSLIVSESQREYAAAFERIGVRLVPVMMPNKQNSFARAWYKLFYAAASWLSASPRDLWYFNPPAFRRGPPAMRILVPLPDGRRGARREEGLAQTRRGVQRQPPPARDD
jgi:hypothetical protein